MDLSDRSSEYYNIAVGSNSMIIPTIVEGYYYFGFLFSTLFSVIIVCSIVVFDSIFYRTKRVEIAYITALVGAQAGWMLPGNFIIFMTGINMVLIPFLVLFLLNKTFKKLFITNLR